MFPLAAYALLDNASKKNDECNILKKVLSMAQESLPPPFYDNFADAYNVLIDIRNLNIQKVGHSLPYELVTDPNITDNEHLTEAEAPESSPVLSRCAQPPYLVIPPEHRSLPTAGPLTNVRDWQDAQKTNASDQCTLRPIGLPEIGTQFRIIDALADALVNLRADSGLMTIISSWSDTMPENEILQMLVEYNQLTPALTNSLEKFQIDSLTTVLRMAQESLCPETYEGFCDAYNLLIDNRRLPLNKL